MLHRLSLLSPLTTGLRRYSVAVMSYEQDTLKLRRAPEHTGVFINNQFLAPTEPWLPVINPATENTVTKVASATQQNVNDAVAAAKVAFKDGEAAWPSLTGAQRAEYLLRIAQLIKDRLDDIAKLESLVRSLCILRPRLICFKG
jgi:delta 1-pyrroline-5-carboxylate dehydrogenase